MIICNFEQFSIYLANHIQNILKNILSYLGFCLNITKLFFFLFVFVFIIIVLATIALHNNWIKDLT